MVLEFWKTKLGGDPKPLGLCSIFYSPPLRFVYLYFSLSLSIATVGVSGLFWS